MRRFPDRRKHLAAIALVALAAGPAFICAQTTAPREVALPEYLKAVEENSLELRAQRQTIETAKAGVSIAGVRPDPQLTAGISSKELYGPNKPNAATATTAGVALTLETGGKRGARIQAAESNVRVAEANVDAFQTQLLSTSAAAFIEACRTGGVRRRKESSLKAFRDLVRANEARLKAGDIGMLELRQSRVESDRFAAEANSAGADAAAALLNLSTPLGRRFGELFAGRGIECRLSAEATRFDPEELTRLAAGNRADVKAAKAAVDNAFENVRLARANRWVDPVVSAGITNVPRVNPVFDDAGNVTNSPTAEKSRSLGLTVSIPIPFSRLQRGELIQAQSAFTQTQLQQQSTLLKAETEVRATYAQYQAAATNAHDYAERVVAEADRVLEGVRTSYRKGAASLLELLIAQRAADDVHLGYLQALADLANSTVKLELSVGLPPELPRGDDAEHSLPMN